MTAAEINADVAAKKATALVAGDDWEAAKALRIILIGPREVAEIQADDNILIGGTLFSPTEANELATKLTALYPTV